MEFIKDSINLDPSQELQNIKEKLKRDVLQTLKKRGAVVGISGGIDSSLVLAICAQTFGSGKVLGVIMPDKESNPESTGLAKNLADKFGVEHIVENITPALEGFDCYRRRDEAMKKVFPEFDSTWKAKIVLPSDILERNTLNIFQLMIISSIGEKKVKRLPLHEYLQIVAASNFKQRSRMNMLYYHAERRNWAVIGTGNKNEHELGFFVKYGDGGADIKPIAHLFKTQVFQLAKYLDVPSDIQNRIPTTDTYSAEQSQEEFFFRLPFEILDLIWLGWEKGIPIDKIAEQIKQTPEQIANVINDLKHKIAATRYLRSNPL